MILQAALDPVLKWAVANSDPANIVLLAAVYWQLRKEHREVRDRVEHIEERAEVLHSDETAG